MLRPWWKCALAAFCMASALGLSPLTAQEQPSAEAPANQPDQPDADADRSPLERLIYVPYKNLKSVFESGEATVFLPYLEYLKLAQQMATQATQPPVQAVITESHYVAKVEKDIARIDAKLTVQALDKPWAEVPVRFGEAAIASIRSDSGKVLLRGTGNGNYALLLPSKGEHQVTLELTAKVRTSPEGRTLELDVPSVGITTFELTVPQSDQTVDLKPQLVAQAADAGENQTRIKASLGSTDKITAQWHSRVGNKPDMELLASVTNHTLVTVEDGLLHTDAWLTYDILRGQLEQVRIAVPKGHRILDVSAGTRVKQWKTADEANRQLLTVELLSGAEGKLTVEVHTEKPVEGDTLTVAGVEGDIAYGIHALDVVRESGQLAVRQGSELTLTVEQQSGLMRIEESEVDARLRQPGAVYYKFYNPNVRLQVSIHPVEPRIIVRQDSQLVFRNDQLRLKADLKYQIERAGLFELQLQLPEGMTVEEVAADGMKRYDVSDATSVLTISLQDKRQGAINVRVSGSLPFDPTDTGDQLLPLIEPLNVERETGHVTIYAPESLEIVTDAEEVVAAQPDPNVQPNPQVQAMPTTRLVSAWTYNRRPVEIPFRVVQKPTRLTATVATRIDVKPELVEVHTTLVYQVRYAGIDTFRFAVPEAVADRVQIRSEGDASPGIKQKSRDEAAQDGWVTWTVVTQREATGNQTFQISYDIKPTVDEAAKTAQAVVQPLRVLDLNENDEQAEHRVTLSQVSGQVIVQKDRALSVSAESSGGDIEPIDVRELTLLPQDGFLAYRYFQQPVKLTLSISKHDIQEVVQTIIPRALVEVVLDREGKSTTRARYQVKSSERQRLRIDLPERIEPLGVTVDGKQVALEKNAGATTDRGWESYVVNVARTKSSDEPFLLTVVYRSDLNRGPFATWGGVLSLRFPQVGGPAAKNVAIQQLRTVVWVPEDYALVGTPDRFTLEYRPRIEDIALGRKPKVTTEPWESWLGPDAGGVFEFPVEGRAYRYSNLGGAAAIRVTWWNLPLYTLVISGALLLIAIVLRNTTWENRLTILLLIVFGLALWALSDTDWAIHGLVAASYGLVAMLAFWLIHALFRPRPVMATAGTPTWPNGPVSGPVAAVIPPPGVFDSLNPDEKESK